MWFHQLYEYTVRNININNSETEDTRKKYCNFTVNMYNKDNNLLQPEFII